QEQMVQAVLETCRKNNLKDAYVRLVVTRGVGDLGLDPRKCSIATVIVIADHISLHEGEAKTRGITALVSWVRRDPVDGTSHEIKSLNYLNSVMAKLEANMSGADEALFLNKEGCVAEGVGENLFVVKRGKITTPPSAAGSLEGITAKSVFALAKKLGYDISEANVTPFQLINADEVFFTGTAAEIVPIREVNWRRIGDGTPGPVTKRLMAEFKKVISDPKEGVPI
ncbi:MAG: aminotransferase class IV, partial [Candidatus Bathyarchaeia archaeon]